MYEQLRSSVLSAELQPGQQLRPQELATANDVSLVVVREALNRLAGEHLVVNTPQRGFRVTPISLDDLADLTDARVLNECAAIHLSVSLGDLDWEATLSAAHHRVSNTPMGPDNWHLSAEWTAAHTAFHGAVVAACPNQRLLRLCASLGESAAIYRCFAQRYDHGRRNVAEEHRKLFHAAIRHDADRACRLHEQHIRRTASIVARGIDAATLPA